MEEKEISIGGAVTMWKSAPAIRSYVQKKLLTIGVGDFCPEPTTRHVALRNALKSQYGSESVKTLPGFANFAVINASVSSKNWEGQAKVIVKSEYNGLTFHNPNDEYDDNGGLEQVTIDNIKKLFEAELSCVPANDVSKMLVKLAHHVGGMACASGAGGAYWIPKDSLSLWKEIADTVEGSSRGKSSSKVFMFTTAMDDDAVRAVVGSLENNICKELEDMEREIASGKLKKRALESRQHALGEKRETIREYESMLGVTLKKLHKAVEQTKKNSVLAAMLALGGTED